MGTEEQEPILQEDRVLDIRIEEAGYSPGDARVRQIEFGVRSGELVGLIGPNGAGKSTTIKAILKLIPHVKGEIAMGGSGTYAYVPEQPLYYDTLTLWEHLSLAGAAYGMEEKAFERSAEELLERFRMTDARDKLPGGMSKGMKQKMMLMLGFLLKPDVYIVDEPFIGLDPRATRDFLRLLEEERKRGAGVLMCTHVLDTAEKICDYFVLLSNGETAAQGDMAQIRKTSGLAEGDLFDCFEALTV
ncbi:ABC transporter ATP-binding protein [Saccharibacillus alkalitolerans]|uniref:ABC transporter ATP-binding protein n=1 Tax=Saccharibacillus alkalitolerans TaxID=2705290 RepID=A0ABX0FCU9_9BACL|nr:ABC transporter ATP-binding protein [Saccharibacillus alkalitolerans]NGZ77448.1 ABC transporter ATP-binding protein [Saccharibacillus alkalitolerans]